MHYNTAMNDDFTCPLCDKTYISQKNLDRHKCKVREKIEYLSTNKGQRSFYLFNKWRKVKKIPQVEIDDFLHSRYFTVFKNFTEYLMRVQIPSIELFFEFANKENIQPNLWCDKRIIPRYYQYLDNEADPIKMAEVSIKTILRYCDSKNIPPFLFFKKIPFNLIVNYVQLRLMSPWVLLLCGEYRQIYKGLRSDQKKAIDKQVNIMLWKIKFEKNPDKVKFIKCLLKQIKI